ncbi:hypothetical protein VTN96DRAFT_9787 [Rasamsonia emersonii]|uniref:Signal peptide-containing protein n=1 Tax=Rasamsonia emersonii (strain ATCC 16479 / CBS 393.64 / IMI 116815) TaxID=1408163 RepID=A0A0F4Z393_RASE3|nr:hypothetical protein T310_1011 [Rasamsonia emersonii CBS 393.64]KKA24977.1 hypothetical protein T310_1011 [Rasamsonia emersonii CBS 393.64]
MWLFRGVQSAIFYYATCTPCATAGDRRRRKREAARTQREKAREAAIVTDQPRVFPQPTPFSTNAGWAEEIALGPGPPARRGGHRPANNRSAHHLDGTAPRLSGMSSSTLGDESPSRKEKGGLGDRLHWMRYQREDEPLWGQEEMQEVRGSSVGISGRGRAETNHSSRYYIAKVPPVNDLHPPIVSGPTSRAEVRWMLQPPPPARVMAGKERYSSVRSSREGSIRRKNGHGRVSDTGEEDEAQVGQSSQPVEQTKASAEIKPNSSRKPDKKGHRPPPITVVGGHRTMDSQEDDSPRRVPLATIASHSKSAAYDEFHLQISSAMNSRSNSLSSLGSPAESLPWTETLYSRPGSKATDDSGKAFHSSLSNVISPVHRGHKKVEAVHVEISEEEGQIQEIRPWRWSFDI